MLTELRSPTSARRPVARLVAALMIVAAGAMAPFALSEPAAAAACNIWPGTNENRPGAFLGAGVNIRTGPGTNCVVLGAGYTNHSVTYRCWTWGDNVNGTSSWTLLRDNSTGVTGWVNDSLLSNFGSQQFC
ncbi:SH3-like domain-containing protein [Allocatelliglobosispora scoriae]|uniref:SH3-like domain-containing protein n=1 Tax=Allocatelliglobosispora scoriae TaxID=643052 RepID=A0A841BM14_9ACTN|nr:SH3 domain-containing protein [Allocatelliglobosispora scoriae]MBB5868695.1 SH3-like domain-containing protein [Allocatelliglobosispora scoriae]